ncbi:ankyrin repeat protein, putative [Trichomonas vaginalis G3]|uniref:Ankyrin repeat protein, putative n=1 Tax=Trichomonas vaginalis (strain ATCC PRA-98 / G3) TaxID=412133 RepID=A2F0U0_TRIV3|nr:Ankyrin repeat family [Trichomonas vaginalis G3]EAY01475.1 ankyrin repeat protein, putative [Trichomonas vaginalis G3]KAI5523367.1 Ankyrin repeat family [Trichomonas vaginalis G3]|eukprot:XP_001314166.1 ankyrin repeat protein [Trichomonas vaginalis G3]
MNALVAFHYAVDFGNKEMVEYFILHCENINIKGHGGDTPLNCAIEHGNIEIVDLLISNNADINLKNYNGWGPLYTAAIFNHKTIFYLKDNLLYSPLIRAAINNSKETLKVLISHGANINHRDNII